MPKYLNTKKGSLESAVLEAVSPAQQAAIAISKKKKAGKPGYDDEGKSLKDDMTTEDKEAYEKFFKSALKKFKVDSPADFKSDEEKKKFFDYIDKNYKADNEETQKNEEVKLQEKPADYLELEFNSSRDAAKAYDYINNKLYSGGHQPFNMQPNEGSSLQFEDMDDADKVMAELKKAKFKFKVYERESVQEETLAQKAARHISDMWAEGAKVKKEEEEVEEEETPKKKKESKKTTMTGKPMNDIVVNPKSQDD